MRLDLLFLNCRFVLPYEVVDYRVIARSAATKQSCSFKKFEDESSATKASADGSKFLADLAGDNSEEVPPVPIPNTEVKPFSADGT